MANAQAHKKGFELAETRILPCKADRPQGRRPTAFHPVLSSTKQAIFNRSQQLQTSVLNDKTDRNYWYK